MVGAFGQVLDVLLAVLVPDPIRSDLTRGWVLSALHARLLDEPMPPMPDRVIAPRAHAPRVIEAGSRSTRRAAAV